MSQNSLLHRRNEDTGKRHINFWRAPEINQRLMTVWEMFIQEKLLNFGKNSMIYDILKLTIILFPSSALVALKASSLAL